MYEIELCSPRNSWIGSAVVLYTVYNSIHGIISVLNFTLRSFFFSHPRDKQCAVIELIQYCTDNVTTVVISTVVVTMVVKPGCGQLNRALSNELHLPWELARQIRPCRPVPPRPFSTTLQEEAESTSIPGIY